MPAAGGQAGGTGPERLITVGRIIGAHGVHGWLRIRSWTQPESNIAGYQPWWLPEQGAAGALPGADQATGEQGLTGASGWRPYRVAARRSGARGLRVRLAGVETMDQARLLAGRDILVSRSVLPPLPGHEFYWADLIGLRVRNRQQVDLGVVTRIIETGANDVLVVEGERQRLIPFVYGRYIVAVDLPQGRMLVDWDASF